jgi:hypothetical protein
VWCNRYRTYNDERTTNDHRSIHDGAPNVERGSREVL